MLYAFVIVIAILFVPAVFSNAYAIWYQRSGRYELHRRLDSVTKR